MKYYDNISVLPLSRFLDVLLDGNLKALIKVDGDDVEEFILRNAWFEIQEQYAIAMQNTEARMYLVYLKEVNILVATHKQVTEILKVMYLYYHPWFGKQLNKLLGSRHDFDKAINQEWNVYTKLLDNCGSLAKGVEMQIEIKSSMLAGVQKKMEAKAGSKPTREYFDKLINVLEEHYKITMDPSISVSRFCDRVTRMVNQFKKTKPK
jgi:hypothetical protein